jgi:hypothetical protein
MKNFYEYSIAIIKIYCIILSEFPAKNFSLNKTCLHNVSFFKSIENEIKFFSYFGFILLQKYCIFIKRIETFVNSEKVYFVYNFHLKCELLFPDTYDRIKA